MTFKDIKTGYCIYVIDRANTTMTVGKVVSTSPSRLETQMGGVSALVIDITVDVEGKSTTYVVQDGSCISSSSAITLAVDRDTALREIESIKAKAESVLDTIDEQRKIVDNCNKILMDHNPELKERKEHEKRMSDLESKLNLILTKLEHNERNVY